jgi:hypothetical protein
MTGETMNIGILDSIRERIPFEQRRRLIQRLQRVTRPALLAFPRRTRPVSRIWGFDRGMPVDRFYIERFMDKHRQDVRGQVLEVLNTEYSDLYGSGVRQRDILDINPDNPLATIVADLAAADNVPADQFDCFILTQTLHLIYDVRSAISHAHRILKPGGVLLATVPTVSRVIPTGGLETDYWRFTLASGRRMFGDIFGPEQVTVETHGNVLVATAFLNGMAREELSRRELETNDPYFPIIVTVRAVKATSAG